MKFGLHLLNLKCVFKHMLAGQTYMVQIPMVNNVKITMPNPLCYHDPHVGSIRHYFPDGKARIYDGAEWVVVC